MSDDIRVIDEAFFRELEELDGEGDGELPSTTAEDKGAVFALLDSLGATSLLVRYDGMGDEGAVEEVVCRGPADAVIELPAHVREAVEDFAYKSLPCGWEINEGSSGVAAFDIAARKVEFCHGQRVVEVREYGWEV